jgi:putative nucleotidyltransferase with HDIG domain
MSEKIAQLEKEIRDLHYNPVIGQHSFSNSRTEEFYEWFWEIHVNQVIEFSKQMAVKYNADLEIVWLAAILHDIARLEDLEPHDEIGAEKAYTIVIEKGFDPELARNVGMAILTHRCKKYIPGTLEQKIIATADAMAHFIPPFYFWVGKYSNNSFEDVLEKNRNKLERDFNEKIFFEDERALVAEHYMILKNWFGFQI